MVGKRQATSNLNHDNWDQEEEPEERGTFRTASEQELKARVIKKARRKIAGGSSGAGEDGADETPAEPKSVFSGFSGFGKPAASSAAGSSPSPFSFLANLQAPAATTAKSSSSSTTHDQPKAPFLFGIGSSGADKPTSSSIFGTGSTTPQAPPPAKEPTSTTDGGKPTPSIFGNTSVTKKESTVPKLPVATSSKSASTSSTSTIETTSEYRESVAELNRSVMKFLQDHMNKSPYCILTPVFKEYEKHLKELQDEESARTISTKTAPVQPLFGLPAAVVSSASSPSKPAATFSFGKPTTPVGGSTSLFGKKPNCTVTSGGTTTTTTTPQLTFGSTAASSAPVSTSGSIFSLSSKPAGEVKPDDAPKSSIFSIAVKDTTTKKDEPLFSPPKTNGFSFGLKSSSDDKPSSSLFAGFGKAPDGAGDGLKGFSFTNSAKPFSFGNIQPPAATAVSEEAEDEEDKPPKVEFKQVVEEDAVFSKRCKVFIKKEKDFGDRGVGTLYLKPVKDSEKTQLLVRADTNLGNILVNLILSEGIPCQRMGKNNVMMVCVPTPEDTKATSLLLRVKTGDEADDLLKKIKEHIK